MIKKINKTEEKQKQIIMLLANNKIIEDAKKDIINHEKLTNKPISKDIKKQIDDLNETLIERFPENIIEDAKNYSYDELFPKYDDKKENVETQYKIEDKVNPPIYNTNNIDDNDIDDNDIDYYDFKEDTNDIAYDVLTLPSLGQCYKNKKSKIKVSFLTAADEDLITSPNLYKDGKIIDVLLSRKILDKNIKPENLVKGDRDAIVLWLRITGYGKELPITVSEPNNNNEESFESVADLTTLKIKDFNLIGDENGYFEFTTPIKNDKLKFKFLTYKELKEYEKLIKNENTKIEKIRLNDSILNIKHLLKNEILNEIDIKNINKILQDLKNIYNKIQITDNSPYTKIVTTGLLMQIVEVNENTDRQYIKNYIKNMNPRDSYELRKYINANEPGVDFKINVNKPENLGGGSFETFLEFDEFIFLNIS